MKIFKTVSDLDEELKLLRKNNQSIGFVPTMGALHNGHLSLIEKSKQENDITVSSIFVNPTQFNDKKDLENYPRMPENDTDKLLSVACNIVFLPTEKEVYPEKVEQNFDFGNLDKVMEGKFRPGHFKGVAQVVSRFFEIIKPDKAYFGEKDFQQLTIIKHLAKNNFPEIGIVACETVREKDGLAMSSRNVLLSDEYRKNAGLIFQALTAAKNDFGKKTVAEIRNSTINFLNNNPFLQVEYFEIVNDTTLEPVEDLSVNSGVIACIAVFAGNIRLIDNMRFF